MSRLGFLLLLWVFFLPGIKVYGSSETSASVDRMSFNAHWNTPIESMNGTLNLADDYYLTDGTPVTDRNYGEMNKEAAAPPYQLPSPPLPFHDMPRTNKVL